MRRLSLAWVLCAVGVALALALARPGDGRAQVEADERPAAGYDHIGHDGKVSVSGADPIACGRCHGQRSDGSLRGQPGHRACFGICHGKSPAKRRRRGSPYPVAAKQRRVCEACHTPAQLARVAKGSREKLGAAYPPYQIEPDYSITFPHDRHQQATASSGGCPMCHSMPGAASATAAPARAPHSRCTACHKSTKLGAAAPMSECKTCHLPAFGPATSPHLVAGAFPVGLRFSHRKHLPRVRSRAPKKTLVDSCSGCHNAVASAGGDELPSPKTAECAVCHDGNQAFSTLEPACTRCHTPPPERTRRPATKPASFSHDSHRRRGMSSGCATCHRSKARGLDPATGLEPTGHAPCSNSGCHADQFVARRPQLCAVCHVGYEPWRSLHRERSATRPSEFGINFDHRRHATQSSGDATTATALACERCHRIDSQSRKTVARGDHQGCSGAQCHDHTAKPTLSSCVSCHRAGARAARNRSRDTAKFSTRARFDHRPHARGTRDDSTSSKESAKLPCERCHSGVLQSRRTAEIPAPKKASCAGCHDGKTAFKMTGHGCKRCHGKL